MPKVRVPVAGTVGKTVFIETDVATAAVAAAAGATIGVDLRLEDGSVPNLLQLANALSVESREAEQWPFTFFNRLLEVPDVLASLALLTDPNENRVLYWDDVANALDFADNLVIDEAANLVSIRSGNTLRILDPGNTDSVSFSHDGADFNIAGVLTADINITGITAIAAGTVDVDFDAITATSYGGILEANLLSRIVNENVTAEWTFDRKLNIDDDGSAVAELSFNTGADDETSQIVYRVAGVAQSELCYDDGGWTFVDIIGGKGTILRIDPGSDQITANAPVLFELGSESAPSSTFIGDIDTGAFSPGANIYAITVGGVEAVRWTGSSVALVRWGMTTGITASTTQTQGQGQLTGSWNEVSIVANNNDVVTLPSLTEGEMCLVINTSDKKLQIFPFSGEDIGAGTNNSVTVKANSSRYYLCIDTAATSFDIATDFTMLQGIEVSGASDDDLLFRSGGDWHDTAGLLTWDGSILTIAGDLRFNGDGGFYNQAPVAKPTGVAVTAAGIHAALVTLNLIAA